MSRWQIAVVLSSIVLAGCESIQPEVMNELPASAQIETPTAEVILQPAPAAVTSSSSSGIPSSTNTNPPNIPFAPRRLSTEEHFRELLERSDLLRFMTDWEQELLLSDLLSGTMDVFLIDRLFPLPPTRGTFSEFSYLERVCISLDEDEFRCRQRYGY